MSDNKPAVATDERRRTMRFPAQVETVSLCFCTPARVINESFNGIALAVDGQTVVRVGQSVSIQYGGAAMAAIVKRVDEGSDGDLVLGLDWVTS